MPDAENGSVSSRDDSLDDSLVVDDGLAPSFPSEGRRFSFGKGVYVLENVPYVTTALTNFQMMRMILGLSVLSLSNAR